MIRDSLAIDIKIISECKDQTGRILVIDCKIEGLPLTLVNIYAPTRDRLAQQITFLGELRDILQNLASKNLMIGGDFNTNLKNEIDKKEGTHEIYTSYTVTYIGHYISTLYITYIRHYVGALFNLSFMFIHCHER